MPLNPKNNNLFHSSQPFVVAISLLILVLGLFAVTPAFAEPGLTSDDLVVGIFPRRNAKLTIKLFKPMAKYLSRKLKRKVRLQTAKDFQAFWNNVKNQQYDLVHYNQLHYILSHEWYEYDVILKNNEFGESTIAGSIIVRRDSGINSLKDLKGKRIVFGGGSMAMQSYIVATYLLQRGGLQKGDYIEAFAKNPPNAIFATYVKQATAAGAGDKVLKLDVVTKKINQNDMIYLARGEQLPHLPWGIKRSLPSHLKNRIQSILSSLDKSKAGKQVLKDARLTGLEKATDAEYDQHRIIIEKVYGKLKFVKPQDKTLR